MFQMIHLYFTSLNKDEEAFASHIEKQKSFLGIRSSAGRALGCGPSGRGFKSRRVP